MDANTMANLIWLKMCEDEHIKREFRPDSGEKGYGTGRFLLEATDHSQFVVTVAARKASWPSEEHSPDVEKD